MIPIAVESMVMQLPPVDLAIVIAAGAIAVSVYTFYISHTHISRREQIKTSRYLWERVNEKYDPIIEIGRSRGWPEDGSGIIDEPWAMLRSVVGEIDYFAYLILVDEIKDEKVLRYYRHHLSSYIETIMRHYASPDSRHDLRDQYPDFNRLIMEWNINMPDEET